MENTENDPHENDPHHQPDADHVPEAPPACPGQNGLGDPGKPAAPIGGGQLAADHPLACTPAKSSSSESAGGKGTQNKTEAERPYFISLREFGIELCNDVAIARIAALLGEIAGYHVTSRAIKVLQANPHGAEPDAIAKAIFPWVAEKLQVEAQKYIVTHLFGLN